MQAEQLKITVIIDTKKGGIKVICGNMILYIIHPDLCDSTRHSLLMADYKLKMKKNLYIIITLEIKI